MTVEHGIGIQRVIVFVVEYHLSALLVEVVTLMNEIVEIIGTALTSNVDLLRLRRNVDVIKRIISKQVVFKNKVVDPIHLIDRPIKI